MESKNTVVKPHWGLPHMHTNLWEVFNVCKCLQKNTYVNSVVILLVQLTYCNSVGISPAILQLSGTAKHEEGHWGESWMGFYKLMAFFFFFLFSNVKYRHFDRIILLSNNYFCTVFLPFKPLFPYAIHICLY